MGDLLGTQELSEHRRGALSALATFGLAGCMQMVPIDYVTGPPADWPALEAKVFYVEAADLPRVCKGVGTEATQIRACAVTNFQAGACYVFIDMTLDEPGPYLEHELAHCRGYGHVGDPRVSARNWEAYKAGQN